MDETFYYSPNDYPAFGFNGTVTPWGWRLQASDYDPGTDETTYDVELGYEDDTDIDYVVVSGQPSDPYAAIMNVAEYSNSNGPLQGGGFPKK